MNSCHKPLPSSLLTRLLLAAAFTLAIYCADITEGSAQNENALGITEGEQDIVAHAEPLATVGVVGQEESVNLWSLLRAGGWAMFPLGFCSMALLWLSFRCWQETRPVQFTDDKAAYLVLENLFRRRDAQAARRELEQRGNVLSRALVDAVARGESCTGGGGREQMETAFTEALEVEQHGIGQWISYLNVIAAVAPMTGLLGTVSGMISAFQTISHGGMGKPELLGGDISEALITTATGLTIGIPAMVAFFVMQNRLSARLLETARQATRLIGAWEDGTTSSSGGDS